MEDCSFNVPILIAIYLFIKKKHYNTKPKKLSKSIANLSATTITKESNLNSKY